MRSPPETAERMGSGVRGDKNVDISININAHCGFYSRSRRRDNADRDPGSGQEG